MSDLSITAASVLAGEGATKETGIAGATITAGQAVYKEAATGKYKLADCNSATAEVRVARGIALNGASDGQPLQIQTAGPITIGATVTAGVQYYLSGTPGGIRPVADNTTGDYPCTIGLATSTTALKLNITGAGAAL